MRKHRVLYGVALGIMMFASFSTQAANQTLGENNMNRTEICKRNFRTLFNGEALTNAAHDIKAIINKNTEITVMNTVTISKLLCLMILVVSFRKQT